MAELNTDAGGSHGKKGGGKPHAKKMSTRIDMTPMVDLAFLLLTFFMLTTTFNKPQTMEVNMPVPNENPDEQMKVQADRTTTILVGKNNRLFYYDGVFDPVDASKIIKTNYSKDGIRKLLIDKNQTVYTKISELEQQVKEGKLKEEEFKKKVVEIKKDRNNRGLIVIIKPEDDSSYENVVNILDEMSITNVASFALVDISDAEKNLISTL
jgi:biopolymer transport protein ExbD